MKKTRNPQNLKSIFLVFSLLIGMQSSSMASNPISLAHEKTTIRIFNQLKQARGLGELDGPFLRIVQTLPNPKFKIAMADNLTDTIYIQNDAVSICMDFMEADSLNGLAFILSHELAHVTHKHGVRHQFINQFQRGFADNEIAQLVLKDTTESQARTTMEQAKNMSVRYQIRKNEAEADLDAGFTSYLAGYSTKTAGPQFLDFAYEVFGLRKRGGLYASLSERKLIAKNTGLKLDTLIKVYELGNSMNIIGEYGDALKCYEYVAKEYESKELLNNMGVMSLSVLAQEFCGDQVPYFVPVTLDFPPDVAGKSIESEELKLYRKHLNLVNTAIYYFEKSANIDDEYYVPLLNKSIALWLRNQLNTYNSGLVGFPVLTSETLEDDLEFSKTFALLAKQVLLRDVNQNTKAMSDVYTQLALIVKVQSDHNLAIVYIEKAIELNSKNRVAIDNKKVFNGALKRTIEAKRSSSSAVKACTEDELILQNFVSDILAENESSMDITIPLREDRIEFDKVQFGMSFKNQSTYSLQQFKKKGLIEESFNTFALVKDNYTQSTACNLSKGSKLKDVLDAYGTPQKILQTPGQSLYKFESEASPDQDYIYYDGIVFVIGSDSEVKRWIVYEKVDLKEDVKEARRKALRN